MAYLKLTEIIDNVLVYRCGCTPERGVVCTTHCQWQGCTDTVHTAACVRGDRVPVAAIVHPDRTT